MKIETFHIILGTLATGILSSSILYYAYNSRGYEGNKRNVEITDVRREVKSIEDKIILEDKR